MALRRCRSGQLHKWTHRCKAGRRWPLEGFVAILGSEAQDAVFLYVRLVQRLSEPAVLRLVGDQRWLAGADTEVLRQELLKLAGIGDLSPDERLSLDQAVELVEYEISNGTGVTVVPPVAGS
jgi:hypothetical protein